MKILIISHEYPPIGGGGANACMHLAAEYAKMGHDVDIVTVWYDGLKDREEQKDTAGQGTVRIYRIHSKRKYVEHCSFKEMLDYLRMALPVASRLEKDNDYDICQVFFGIPSGPIGYYLKKKYKLPYVIRFGGGDIPGFQDRFTKVYKLIGPAIKVLWKNADALVANSRGLKELAEGFYAKKKIDIIPNGADLSDISRGKNDSTVDDKVITLLFVSRLIERKGLQDVLPQLKELRQRSRDIGKDIRLRVVGDGPYRETLEDIVRSEEIADIVEFCGQKSKKELPEYYSSADIFIFPSRKEGMPNVVLEAMSYGLPIVMTPCQGSEELIDGNGYISDVGSFGENIYRMISDRSEMNNRGHRSREIIEDRFLWEKTADRYIELFNSIIAQT